MEYHGYYKKTGVRAANMSFKYLPYLGLRKMAAKYFEHTLANQSVVFYALYCKHYTVEFWTKNVNFT